MSIAIHVIHYRPFSYELKGPVLKPEIVWGADPELSELRCHRRAWQSGAKTDYVGFHHYRRAFLYQIDPPDSIRQAAEQMHRNPWQQVATVSRDEFVGYLEWLDGTEGVDFLAYDDLEYVDLIVPRPLMLGESMADHYRSHHQPEDWEILAHLLREEGLDDGRLPFLTAFNMFVARHYLFDEYMTLWDRVIGRARELVAPSDRVFGYLSERLFTSWVHHLRCERPWLNIQTCSVLFCPEMT